MICFYTAATSNLFPMIILKAVVVKVNEYPKPIIKKKIVKDSKALKSHSVKIQSESSQVIRGAISAQRENKCYDGSTKHSRKTIKASMAVRRY